MKQQTTFWISTKQVPKSSAEMLEASDVGLRQDAKAIAKELCQDAIEVDIGQDVEQVT